MTPQPRATINAARIIGPVLGAGGALMITQHARLLGVIDSFLENDGLSLLAAFLSLMFGLAILVLHPYWRGITRCLISGIGVLAAARGLFLMFAPDMARDLSVSLINTPQVVPIAGCVMALLGLWLTVFSFITPPEDGLGYFS